MKKYQKIKKSSLNFQNKKNNKFLNLYLSFFQLKNTLRTGRVKHHRMEEKYVESVANHSYWSKVCKINRPVRNCFSGMSVSKK